MTCSHCGTSATPRDGRCVGCGTPFGSSSPTVATGVMTPIPPAATPLPPAGDETRVAAPPLDTPTRVGPPTSAATGLSETASLQLSSTLSVGQNFGTRYHIIRLLGVGGMGAVYQAWDTVLEVAVAIKIIRPDATMDPEAAQSVLKRFKRELLLARQVTHTNVVRIHDLGEIDGITYITMPYIQGSDLYSILKREGRLAVDRAIGIAKQVASGLAVAHEAGIVHRDLKPANIMLDAEDHAVIMDFGIARSTSNATVAQMTATGAVVGTVEYMAPEQARGESVDQRADIYSFGLILNDLLLGRRQTTGASGVAELIQRMQTPPAALRSVDPTIPAWIESIVTKCLQPDPAVRYQTMRELVTDLDEPERAAATARITEDEIRKRSRASAAKRRVIVAASLAVAIVVGAVVWSQRDRFQGAAANAPSGPAVSLAVLPFRNASGDPSLDSLGSSLSQVLVTTLGQSSHVRPVPSDRLMQVLQDLRITQNANLSPGQLASVAEYASARRVLWGQYSRFGNAIRIDATLQDLDRGESVPLNAMAPNEAALLTAITELAEAVRKDLARGSPDVLAELQSTSWKPSTSSFEALRLYNEGLALTRQGTHQEALKAFEAATKQDSNFALAYSAMARSYSTLGYDTEATQFSRRAMSLSDALPPQEKHRIAATHYSIANDTEKAIESYELLVKAAPEDTKIRFDLGELYENSGALDQAREQFAKVVELDPKFVEGLLALGRVEIRRGNPQPSLEHLDKALTLAIQLDKDETRANVLQAIGIAYFRLNKPAEALKRYEESLAIKQRLGNKRGMAASYVQIGEVQRSLGDPRAAEQSYREAEKLRREIGDKTGLSIALMERAALLNDQFGRPRDALPLIQEALTISRDTGNRNLEARALNNIGAAYSALGQYSDAQTYYERALEIRQKAKAPLETADTLHNLGETFVKMGRYDQALQRYVSALELRRSAGDRRMAAYESYGIGTVFDYQGRYGAAIKSKDEALKTVRDLKLRDAQLVEILSSFGSSLSLGGRTGEAQPILDEALKLSRELKNANLESQALRFEAERRYYARDLDGALRAATEAAQAGGRASDRGLVLSAQASLAIVSSAAKPTTAAAAKLATLSQDAEAMGLKALSVECAVQHADTLMKVGDRAAALREIDRALAKAEELGLKVMLAKAHYVKAALLRAKGDAAARRDYAMALRLLEELKADEGNQELLKRADLASIYAESVQFSKAS